VGQLADSGAAAMPRPLGRKPWRARRRRQVSRPAPAGQRYPPSRRADGRACTDRAWPVLRAGYLLAAQAHSQGRSLRSRRHGDGRKRPPL